MSEYDPLSFFDGDIDAPAAASSEPAGAPAAEPAAQAPAAPEAPVAPSPAAPAAVEEEFKGAPAGFVPYGALKEERTKRQTLEDVVKGLQAPKPANGSPPAASQPAAPVPAYGTPEHGFYLQQQMELSNLNSSLNVSEARAIAHYGADEVRKVQEWAATQDEFFFGRVLRAEDPYATAKAAYDVEQAAKGYGSLKADEVEAFKQWQASQAAAAAQAAAPAVNNQPAAIAPSAFKAAQAAKPVTKVASSGSIVTTPTAGGVQPGEKPAGPGVAFNDIFE